MTKTAGGVIIQFVFAFIVLTFYFLACFFSTITKNVNYLIMTQSRLNHFNDYANSNFNELSTIIESNRPSRYRARIW